MGRVLVDGKDTQAQSVEDIVATVAIVFQNPFSMIFAKTVYDELAFGPKNVGLPPDDISDLIPIVAEQCGVTQLLDKSPFASSFGEKKRICVGAVLTMRPKCIILDEPTAGQDYRSYTEFMKFIRSLSDKGHAFVLITHDTDLAIEYADRTVILNDGRIVADGPTRRILADPKTLTDNAIRETSLVEISRKLTNGQFVFSLSDLLGMVNGTKTRS
jgi:energy-coupling factor transport system ATP-binding protein